MASLQGDNGNNTLTGGGESDMLSGYGGADTLRGMAGPDTIYSGHSDDVLGDLADGGDGDDYLALAGAGSNTLIGGTGNDYLYAERGSNRLEGGPGNDALSSASIAADTLLGGDGNDNVSGGGLDLLDGGAGNDVMSGGGAGGTLHGGDGDDQMQVWGDGVAEGGAGNDTLNARGDAATPRVGAVTLRGGAGNDTLFDNNVATTLAGGAGDDLIYVENAGSQIVELTGEGIDKVIVVVRLPSWALPANVEDADVVSSMVRTVTGNALHNTIRFDIGGQGLIDGGDGDDSLHGYQYDDTLIGGAGVDALYGSKGNDLLDGGIDPDTLDGSEGNDTLLGGAGSDSIDGGAGDDLLDGGADADWMSGGLGRDRYFVDHIDDVVDERPGADVDTVEIGIGGYKIDRAAVEQVIYRRDALPLAYWVDALTTGFAWQAIGQGGEVTFGRAPTLDLQGWGDFGSSDMQALHAAFGVWSQGTRLTFRETAAEEADVLVAFVDLEEVFTSGLSFPVPEFGAVVLLIDDGGKGGLLASDPRWNTVLLHEVGHALGLKHPGDYAINNDDDVAPFLPAAEDDLRYTLMRYHAATPRPVAGFTTQLPLLDRAAAQYLYGLADGFAGGDTSWRVATLTQTASATRVIEDSAGIDTVDASDIAAGASGTALNVTIDLREGGRIAVGAPAALITAPGQAAVGYGSVLEHATGSAGDDTITGNEVANRLTGGAGNDTLLGAPGDDTLTGGAGADTLIDEAGQAGTLDGGDGDDVLALRIGGTAGPAGAALQQASLTGGAGFDTLELRLDPQSIDYALAQALLAWREWPAGSSGGTGSDPALGFTFSGLESLRWRQADGAPWQAMAPVVRNTPLVTDEDVVLEQRLPALDLGGAPLTYTLLEAPPAWAGEMTLAADGLLRFVPRADQSYDTLFFTWRVDNGTLATEVRTPLAIRAVDDAPVQMRPVRGGHTTPGGTLYVSLWPAVFEDRDSALVYSFTLADGSPLPAWMQYAPMSNSFSVSPGFGHTGEWTVRMTAGVPGASTSTSFTVGVYSPANRDPRFERFELEVVRDTPYTLPLPVDDDGDPITATITRQPEHGTLTALAGGRWQYAPAAGYIGDDSIYFELSDDRHGFAEPRLLLHVRTPDRPVQGSLLISGRAEVAQSLQPVVNFVEPDGLGFLSWTWFRDGVAVPNSGTLYFIGPADIGHRLHVEVAYTDGAGHQARVVSQPSAVVPDMTRREGTAAAERLSLPGSGRLFGRDGNDTLEAGSGFVQADGGAGDDRILLDGQSDTIDGGAGFDTLVLLSLNDQQVRAGAPLDTVRGIEAVIGTAGPDHVSGSPVTDPLETGFIYRMGRGDDVVNAGDGIDAAQLAGERAEYRVWVDRGAGLARPFLYVSQGPDGNDQLYGVERLRFDDILLAFGTRAVEIAQVAFALWSKGIAAYPYLFGRGISYYDVGYSWEQMVDAALGFFTGDSAQQFAERLAGNVASGKSAAELLALMQANGGAGAGQAGRNYATTLVAQHPDNMTNIELAGFLANGIPAALVADGNLLFASIGGSGG